MSILRINGGVRLRGSVKVQGAKNSVLPILAAAILADGETVIHNCPDLSDVDAAIKILRHLGCRVKREGETVTVDPGGMDKYDVPDSLMREMRSSVMFLGAILGKTGKAVLSRPGGCELGPRPIDLHIAALKTLGAEISETGGNIVCTAGRLTAGRIDLPLPSVGATENSMLAASKCRGVTTITNAAREPEIEDLQGFLKKMGVNVRGAGTSIITVEGTEHIHGTEFSVMPDRIAAATYMAAVAGAGGSAELLGVVPEHVSTISDVLSEMGCDIKTEDNRLYILSEGKLKAPKTIQTKPYPGFPTDAQPPVMAASLRAEGTTVFVENIFENRYRQAGELRRMGADIKVEGKVAIVSGVRALHGASVSSTDLRGGAALLVAAMSAEGTSDILETHHIDRGYERPEEMFRLLGADIKRIE